MIPTVSTKQLARAIGALGFLLFAAACGSANDAVSRTVGPEGGKLLSADGRFEVDIPAGALTKATEITLTPVQHDVVRGIGSGYRVTPEGALAAPAKLSFLYSEEELAGASPGGLSIAFREDAGDWMAFTQPVVDGGARRVSVSADHFSEWVLFEMIFLEPATAAVKVGRTQQLQIMFCAKEDPESLITPLVPQCQPLASATASNWQVDGAPGGNAISGTVSGQGTGATFTAPQAIPAGNPVSVSAEVTLPGGTAKGILFSQLEIVEECPAPICRLTGTTRYRQQTSDDLWITGEAQVTWEFQAMDGTSAVYVPTGTANVSWEHVDCQIGLSPSSFTVQPGDGELRIDFSASPPTYSGFASSNDDNGKQTWTCPNSDPFEEIGSGGSWFKGSGTVVNAGLVEGSFTTDTEVSSWRFEKP